MKGNWLFFLLLTLLLACCTSSTDQGKAKGHVSQPSDTLYTLEAAMDVYASQPERALQIIDSAEIVGNLSDFGADMLRAKVYAGTWEEIACDSAILIGERLLLHDSVKANPDMQENVLEILLNASRLRICAAKRNGRACLCRCQRKAWDAIYAVQRLGSGHKMGQA